MCTFQDKYTVVVCDVAIGCVKEIIDAIFGDTVQYTSVEGQGTLVEAKSIVNAQQFQALARAAIAAAQVTNTPRQAL